MAVLSHTQFQGLHSTRPTALCVQQHLMTGRTNSYWAGVGWMNRVAGGNGSCDTRAEAGLSKDWLIKQIRQKNRLWIDVSSFTHVAICCFSLSGIIEGSICFACGLQMATNRDNFSIFRFYSEQLISLD